MSTATKTRWKTGETCVYTGTYKFDGYTDGTSTPSPVHEGRETDLSRDETFRKGLLVETETLILNGYASYRIP